MGRVRIGLAVVCGLQIISGASACVTHTYTNEVIVNVTVPCATFGDSDTSYDLEVYRATEATEGGCSDGSDIYCFPSDVQTVKCDETAVFTMNVGVLPEVIGVAIAQGDEVPPITQPLSIVQAASFDVVMGLASEGWDDTTYCSLVSSCLTGLSLSEMGCE